MQDEQTEASQTTERTASQERARFVLGQLAAAMAKNGGKPLTTAQICKMRDEKIASATAEATARVATLKADHAKRNAEIAARQKKEVESAEKGVNRAASAWREHYDAML